MKISFSIYSGLRRGGGRGFSLSELLIVVSIIGIVTLVVWPAVSNLTRTAEEQAAKRNAQLLSSAAAAARASGDPSFNSLSSKAAMVTYLAMGGSADFNTDPEFAAAKVSLGGISAEELYEASKYLSSGGGFGMLTYGGGSLGSPIDDSGDPESGGGTGSDPESNIQGKWKAQLLAGAASLVNASGDDSIVTAGSKGAAISVLVDGGLGGSMVAGMSGEEQDAAKPHLQYTDGALNYVPDNE